jgi:hypothetical protein
MAQTRRALALELTNRAKWIGDSSGHESGLTDRDVLDGALMLSHALKLVHDPSEARLLRHVGRGNRRRGPVPRTSRPGLVAAEGVVTATQVKAVKRG